MDDIASLLLAMAVAAASLLGTVLPGSAPAMGGTGPEMHLIDRSFK